MAEAMLLEKPVICTGYSGNLDFCNSDTAYLVNYDLIPVQPHEYIGAEQQVWADAHVDHAAELMREVFDNEEKRNRIARNSAEFVRSQYSAERVGRIYQGRINEILKSAQLSYPARSTGAAPLNGNDARSSMFRKLLEKASLSFSR
jgi:glycosyltransferase involved in cell wall biosynthesis